MLISSVDAQAYESVYVVGDLHGCYSLLMHELNAINFIFDRDLLICTGDLIDKGDENLECVGLLDQTWFLTVRGNHEEICIQGQHDSKIKDLHVKNGGAWFYRQFQKTRQRIIDRLIDLPLVIEVELEDKKIGIIHADIDIHDWNIFKDDVAKGDYKISGIVSTYANCLWGRGRIRSYSDQYDVVKNIDEIYLGHTIVKEHTKIDNCHYIDVGSYFTKKLCLIKVK